MYNPEGLSSSQYAFRSGIILQRYFWTEEDENSRVPVYYTFKKKGRKKVAYKFPNKIHSLDCFPRTFNKEPRYSFVKNFISSMAFKIGFLNKEKHTSELMGYLHIVYDNKYYFYNFNINIDSLRKNVEMGKNKELSEMELETRKYVWDNEYKNLKKSLKSKIIGKDRFKEVVNENTNLVFDAVQELMDSADFIHTKLVAEKSGLPSSTVDNYLHVHRKDIDRHNRSVCQTDNYNKYLLKMSMTDINNAILNLRFEKEKVNIKSIAKRAKLHRNTVSKLNKVHNFTDKDYKIED